MTAVSTEPTGNLASRAARGTAAAFLSQGGKFALNFGVGIALARLLSPEDFGLFAIAFAITGFLEFAKDGGMVVPVIQSETLTQEQLDTLFWFNSGVGLAVTLVCFAAAPIVGRIYSDARLVPITCALALVFLAGGLSTQHLALLRRQMRFTTLAACEVVALAIAAAAAIIAAVRGAQYWALVLFQLVREVLQTAFVIAATRWLPAWPRRWASIGPLVRFGGLMMVFDIIGYLNLKVDNLIVAWFLGPAALGFYDKAYQLLLLPVNQINAPLSNVVHSTLSRLQREPVRYRAYLARALVVATGLGLPLIAFLGVNARTVIAQLFGAQWLPSVPIFQALAPAAGTMTVTTCVGWIFLSLGRARRQLRWAAFTTVLTVAAFLIGARWGAVGVALAFSISRVVLFVPTLVYTCHDSPVSWTSVLATSARPAVASALAAAASLALDALFPVTAWTLLRNGIAFAAVYHVCWLITPGGRTLVRENLLVARALTRNP
jgi:O-antigen/teichoic acid export membrane protein